MNEQRISASERLGGLHLTWSVCGLDLMSNPMLRIEMEIHALQEVYLGDRLWIRDGRKRAPDPHLVYRFIGDDGSLRLIFDQVPCPPNASYRVTYQPLFSRVGANETYRRTFDIPLPVYEYSSLARDIDADAEPKEVSAVILVLSYRLRETMTEQPRPPLNETVDNAGYIVHDPLRIVSMLRTFRMPALRRTGYIARYALPGEPPPGPMPYND